VIVNNLRDDTFKMSCENTRLASQEWSACSGAFSELSRCRFGSVKLREKPTSQFDKPVSAVTVGF
jgi:hypothetical protein